MLRWLAPVHARCWIEAAKPQYGTRAGACDHLDRAMMFDSHDESVLGVRGTDLRRPSQFEAGVAEWVRHRLEFLRSPVSLRNSFAPGAMATSIAGCAMLCLETALNFELTTDERRRSTETMMLRHNAAAFSLI